jgi:Na+-transporting NADH:ubiquinone oxidoreductase subunit D
MSEAVNKDSTTRALGVALAVAFVCALLVSIVAVGLRPIYKANIEAERIAQLELVLAALSDIGRAQTIDNLEARLVDLASGEFDQSQDPATYDKRRALLAQVYLIRAWDNSVDLIILPVSGRGYQSTLRAWLVLDGDARTVRALKFYQHGETPGVGARIEEPEWEAQWRDLPAWDDDGVLRIGVRSHGGGYSRRVRFRAFLATNPRGTTLMPDSKWRILTRPLIDDNPLTLQILGICSALAVTTSLDTALLMSFVVVCVLAIGSGSVSLIRNHLPHSVRIIVQITIIASLVIVVDQVLQAYAFELSKRLSVFVGLIITNCIVLGRAEGYAMHNGFVASVLDGIGNGLGYSLILIIVGAIREFFGKGSLLNVQILIPTSQGGSFEPLHLMLLPPSAFFIIGGIIWVIRRKRPQQVEKPEFTLRRLQEESE